MVSALFAAASTAEETAPAALGAVTEISWLIPLLPFLAAGLIAMIGKRLPKKGSEIGIVAVGAAALLSYITIFDYVGGDRPVLEKAFEWFPFGAGKVLELGMRIDGLTAVMFVVVTTVSLMVQIYSFGYMHGDKRFTWYYTALNVFTGSMLLLVISNNLLQLLVGWELVGICSYLLIGHWWEETPNSNAAIKAFVTTKTGDVPFMIGIFVLFAATGTFNIGEILTLAHDHELATGTLMAAALLLFGGAIGKSAQFPLHVWLPDAMAGPTPVSALIHAATMVTAGVFLTARMFPVFEASVATMDFVAVIGAITMLLAALLAMVQDDIKKVLAYSTISQLAYMIAALGVGAGNAGIFHLFTHAWFKALLFLGAGSVIHAVHSNNMSEMGGLKRFMPVTYKTFLIGSLALAGIFPLAGFWSKDEILTEAFRVGAGTAHHSPGSDWVGFLVYGVGIVTAFLTAFYMSRAVHLTFEGDYVGHGKPHESPKVMTVPLMILAALGAVGGFVGIPGIGGFAQWVGVGTLEGEVEAATASIPLMLVSLAIAVGGIALGRRLYLKRPAREPLERLGWFHTVLTNNYYLDHLYYRGLVYPIRDAVSAAMYWLNQNVFDGAVNGAAATASAGGGFLKYVQTGDVQRYAAILFVGVALLAFLFTRFS